MKQIEQSWRTGKLKISDLPAPRLGEGGLLVASRASLISTGTDKQFMEIARASLAGKAMARPDLVRRVIRNVQQEGLRPTIEKVFTKLDNPIPLGYSLAGEAIEIGRRVTGYAVGDRVACAGAGYANHAEINFIPKNLVVRIPDGVSDEDASFVTLGAIALQGVRQTAPTLGETVVVTGLGLIGLLTVQLLKANGCRVVGFDPNAGRAALARSLGADVAVSDDLREAVDGFTRGVGADAVVVAASSKSSEPLNQAADISRVKGRVVVVGLVGMSIDRDPFYKRELDLRLSMSYGPGRYDPSYELAGNDYPLPYVRWTEQRNMEAFLHLVAEGRVTPSKLVTHRFPIAEAAQAYDIIEKGDPHLAMVLTFPDNGAHRVVRSLPAPTAARAAGRSRVGFIGMGNYAKGMLLPALKKVPGVELTGVATSTGLSAGAAAEKYGFTTAATDPAAVLGDASTDTVFVATRHDTHALLTADALRAGKHVFCEKPLAMNDAELDDVLEAARSNARVLTVGFNRRFAPLLVQAREALGQTGPFVMLYRVNAGAVPAESWVRQDEGGGRIIGEVCHFVDALAFLSGSAPVEVAAQAARDHEDAVSVILKFADGSTGAIVYSSLGDPSVPKEYIEVFAPGRVVQLEDFRRLTIAHGGRRKTVSARSQDKGQAELVRAFMDAVMKGGAAPIPLDDLAAVTRATFAIEESLRAGAIVVMGSSIAAMETTSTTPGEIEAAEGRQ